MYWSKCELLVCNFGRMQMPAARRGGAGVGPVTPGLRLARWCRCDFLGDRAARRTWVGQLLVGILQSVAVQRRGLRSAGEAADRARSGGSRARGGAGVRWWILGSVVVSGTLSGATSSNQVRNLSFPH